PGSGGCASSANDTALASTASPRSPRRSSSGCGGSGGGRDRRWWQRKGYRYEQGRRISGPLPGGNARDADGRQDSTRADIRVCRRLRPETSSRGCELGDGGDWRVGATADGEGRLHIRGVLQGARRGR